MAEAIPILSFCVSTLNRAARIKALADSVLAYDGYDIELVVINNGSDDDTDSVLSGIDDKRFRYFKHETNIGSISTLHALFKAKGIFSMLISDEDTIATVNITRVVTFLREYPELTVVLPSMEVRHHGRITNERVLGLNYRTRIYHNNNDCKLNTLLHMGFFHVYISGIIINTKLLQENFTIEDIKQKGGRCGHGYYMDSLLMMGDAATLITPLILRDNTCSEVYIDTRAFIDSNNVCCLLPERRLYDILTPEFNNVKTLNSKYGFSRDELRCVYLRVYFHCIFEITDAISVGQRMENVFSESDYTNVIYDFEEMIELVDRRFLQEFDDDTAELKSFVVNFSKTIKTYYSPDFDINLIDFFKRFCSHTVSDYVLYLLNTYVDVLIAYLMNCGRELKRQGNFEKATGLFKKVLQYLKQGYGVFNQHFPLTYTAVIVSCNYHLGDICYLEKHYDEAINYFNICVTLTNNGHKAALERLMEMRDVVI